MLLAAADSACTWHLPLCCNLSRALISSACCPAGSQLEDIISGIQPAAAAARTVLQTHNRPGAAGSTTAAAGLGNSSSTWQPQTGLNTSAGSSRLARGGGLVQLQFEGEGQGPAGGSRAGTSMFNRLAQQQQQQQEQEASAEIEVVGPPHLVAQLKAKQQQGGDDQQQQQLPPKKAGSKQQPLRMGQFLRSWNSTQQEEKQQQQQQQQEEEKQQQHQERERLLEQQRLQQERQQRARQQARQQAQQQPKQQAAPQAVDAAGQGGQLAGNTRQQQQQPGPPHGAGPPGQQQQQGHQQQQPSGQALPTDAKSFFKLLQEQLPAEQMAAVKELLTTYRCEGGEDSVGNGRKSMYNVAEADLWKHHCTCVCNQLSCAYTSRSPPRQHEGASLLT